MKNVNRCFPKPNTMSLNVFFHPQPKNTEFIVIEMPKETREYKHLRSCN